MTAQGDTMTLSGLAAANGPWLAMRLRRLAEHSGQPLPEEVVEGAVTGCTEVLHRIIQAEGRPSVNIGHENDPAAFLGRELARAHMASGLDMPGSVRVLRLMRRAYDDLVRESWVGKDSRARAHEDVERFFERALIGHFLTWAESGGAKPAADPAHAAEIERLQALLERREDELRRALETTQKAASALSRSQTRIRALGMSHDALQVELADLRQQLAKAEEGAHGLTTLRAEFAAANARALSHERARAEAKRQALDVRIHDLETERDGLGKRLAELENALALRQDLESGRVQAVEELERARVEADKQRDKVEQARAELDRLQANAQDIRARAEAEANVAQAEAERLRGELRTLKEAHAGLNSEAEAMRARLYETGSRVAEVLRAEDGDAQARVQALEARLARATQEAQALAARVKEQNGLIAFKDERLSEQGRAVLETQELLARLGAVKDEIATRAQAIQEERDTLAARLTDATTRIDSFGSAREKISKKAQAIMVQLQSVQDERDALAARLKAAQQTTADLAARLEQAGSAQAQAIQAAQQAGAQAQARMDELAATRDALRQLLAAHLSLTGEAVAAVDAGGAFTAYNARFPALFGIPPETLPAGLEAVTREIVLRLQDPAAFQERLRALMTDPAQVEPGFVLATRSGQTLVFRSGPTGQTGRPEAGALSGRLFTFQDVSLERDMEQLLREIEAITRYELGSSLTAFIHLPQELMDQPGTTPEQAQKLAVIRDSGYRIVNTVNMAVDIFRMERGLYQMPQGRTLDLAVVARRAAKDLEPLAQSRHVVLELLQGNAPLPQNTALPAPGDAILAHALVANLLREALESAPRQSSVSLALGVEGPDLALSIRRAGTLAPDETARFFDKPLDADSNGLKRARYAAKLIAKHLGASLAVNSTPDAGTTLTLHLPKG